MATNGDSVEAALIRKRRPDFHPLLIGLHWPSLPWGNQTTEAQSSEQEVVERLAADYADRHSDMEEARQAPKDCLVSIFTEHIKKIMPWTGLI